jgi:aspartyl-tRNA(Asn)/glutamyl-tRNA(Gln) amidotransferase subunit C
VDIQDLKETAALAHLNMDEEELAAAFPAFERMLGYFAAMQGADQEEAGFSASFHTEGMAASARIVGSGYFRADSQNPISSNSQSSRNPPEEMLEKAGDRDGRFIVVPNVL